MKVFIADDEHQYRTHIGKALKRRGHTVESAETGRVAIARAVLFRPDVLVADWMFRDQLHGVHVATALQSVFPDMKTVLISGFASEDLALDARRAGIDTFLEKPFDIAQVASAVESDPSRDRPPGKPEFAMVELDGESVISYANARARELLGPGGEDRVTGNLGDYLGPGAAEALEKSRTMWAKVAPAATPDDRWYLRSRRIDESTIVILLPDVLREFRSHPVLQNLLDVRTGASVKWPLTDRVLVIDDSSAVRQMYHQSLERVGCVSYRAGDREMAIRFLREDTRLTVAIVDYNMPGIDTRFLIDEMRSIRPDIKIVGSSGEDRRAEFRDMGVDRYLGKPWNVPDLVNVLRK